MDARPRQPAPAATNGITLSSPHEGTLLGPDAPPLVVVEGRVESSAGSPVWLVANDRRVAARVQDGRFRQALPLLESSLVVWAETRMSDGRLNRWSRPLTVQAASPTPSGVVLVMDWPRAAGSLEAELIAIWRERPERPSAPGRAVPLNAFRSGPDSRLPEAFSLGDVRPGVYTFLLRYDGATAADEVKATVHTATGGSLRIRERGLGGLSGAGARVLARVLLPQGIHWDDDEWFSGRSESGHVVTKFRFPDGITWSERKADVE